MTTKKRVYGPSLEDLLGTAEEKDQEDAVGPMPLPKGASEDRESEVEEKRKKEKEEWERVRGEGKKNQQQQQQQGPARPDWMTKVPTDRSSVRGDGARTFRKVGIAESDRSWEESPAERARREALEAEEESRKRKERGGGGGDVGEPKAKRKEGDERMTEREMACRDSVERYNAIHRPKTLIEQHAELAKVGKARVMGQSQPRGPSEQQQEGAEVKKKDDEGPPAFWDRERDLDVGKISAKSTQSMLSRAGVLGSRFAHGETTTKFL